MNKTFNIYCDESTHLPHDGQPYLVYSYVSIAYNQLQFAKEHIRDIRRQYSYTDEFKWININEKTYQVYKKLVEYFFMTDMNFRAVVMDKTKLPAEISFDELYVRLYFQLLHHHVHLDYKYNIYIDIKDTCSQDKLRQLKDILRWNSSIGNCQFVKSHESLFIQVADVLMGALNYNLRVEKGTLPQRDNAKSRIVELIKSHANISLPTNFAGKKPMSIQFFSMD